MIGISAYGGYVPRMRMPREEIAKANSWLNPGLRGQAKGERSMGNWDEDALTMAVEASRDCLSAASGTKVDAVYLASTTLPFADRLNAGIVGSALNLGEQFSAADLGSSQRVGISALAAAISGVQSGRHHHALVASADRRKAAAGSSAEISYGDGAAAFLVAQAHVIAEYLGAVTHTVDFIDHYRGAAADFDYEWEERWVRDEGYQKIVPPVLTRLLAETGVSAAQITHFILPAPGDMAVKIGRALGIAAEALAPNLLATAGNMGAAHAMVMLAQALETARPGALILVAAFGQGCEAMLFRVTEEILSTRPQLGVSGYLAQRVEERRYMKLLVFSRLIPYDKGMRAEFDRKAAPSLMYRQREYLGAFVGGKCESCGTPQIPRNRSCVKCAAVDTQKPHPFADAKSTVVSWSADFLAYTVDPPHHFGMIDFAGGGRIMMDMTDVRPGAVDVGTEMRMVFRIKDYDDSRNTRRYFWKAMPVSVSL